MYILRAGYMHVHTYLVRAARGSLLYLNSPCTLQFTVGMKDHISCSFFHVLGIIILFLDSPEISHIMCVSGFLNKLHRLV